jgi:hypothetical protein
MALATLSVDLVAKMASFEQDLGKAARAAESNAAKMNAAFGSITSGLKTLTAGVSLGGLVAFAKATIDSLDALNDLSDATGASIENISALQDVAARTGTSFEGVQTALIKFNAALNSAKKDSPQALAIEAIGLNVEKLKALDPAEALRQTAVALAGFADDGNKARLVQELFGKSLKEVAPLLKDLAESGGLVATVTTEQAKQAEKFNIQLFTLQKNMQDVARDMAGPMITSINQLIDKFKEGEKAGKGFWEVGFENYLANIRKIYGQMPNTNKREASGLVDGSLMNAQSNARLLRQEGTPVLPRLPDRLGGDGTAGAARQSEAERYLETLTKQLEKAQDLTAVQQLGFDIVAGRAGKLTVDEQNNLVQLAQKIDTIHAESQAEKDLIEVLKQKRQASIEAGNAVAKSNEEYQALLARLLAATPTANLESQRNDVQLLTAEFEAGRISETLYLEAVTSRLDLVGEKVQNTKSLAEELGLTFTSAFEDAIVGGKSFDEVLQGIEQDILRIMIRKSVTEPVGAFLSAGITSILGFDGGGYTGSSARAGGLDGKGGFMAMLHPQETVVDHTKGQRAGGPAVTVVQNFTVGDVASISMVRQAVATSQRQIVSAFARSQNYGGAVA